MSKKNVVVDADGIEIGSRLDANRTVRKRFGLSSKRAEWPRDAEDKPISIPFNLVLDLNGVDFDQILDDAIRTKIIRLQNALRGTEKSPNSYETLLALSKEPLHRHYDSCGTSPENPEKAMKTAMSAISGLSPELKAQLLEELLKQQNG